MEITDEIIAATKAANPGKKLHLLRVTGAAAIFATPPQDVWDTYWDILMGPAEGRGSAAKHLVLGSVVYPAREQFARDIAQRPGLVQSYYDRLTEIAGQTKVIESKEL